MMWEIRQGDVLHLLRQMPSESVHMVVTSPPYLGLRAYKTEPQVWGGEAGHTHEWNSEISIASGQSYGANASSTLTTGTTPARREEVQKEIGQRIPVQTASCRCGAWLGELGLEPTPELYVQHLVEVFKEVRRVMRKDGTMWLNMGDSYWGGGFGTSPGGDKDFQQRYPKQASNQGSASHETRKLLGSLKKSHPSLKPKDLIGIPWRVAFALQANGWWLRSDIIWSKPNPMPESVTDRPTRSHEYVFMLTKSKRYYYDQEAVREPIANSSEGRYALAESRRGQMVRTEQGFEGGGPRPDENPPAHYKRGQGRIASRGDHVDGLVVGNVSGRNLRTIWTIPTQAFPDAHFATFPEKLVEPCIRAGTSERGCCTACGAPWERQITKEGGTTGKSWHPHIDDLKTGNAAQMGQKEFSTYQVRTLGWHPTCSCPSGDPIPCTVLDPFVGSGTTCLVALKLGRSSIGIELNPEYITLATQRIEQEVPLLARIGR